MAAWKTSPRIDVELGSRIMKLKRAGSQLRGLTAFIAIHRSCLRGQLDDDNLPWSIALNTRFLNKARRELRQSLRQTFSSLTRAGHDPKTLFASFGIVSPTELLALDDERLVSEVRRLCTNMKRRPQLRSVGPIFGLKLNAHNIEDYRRGITRAEAAIVAAPAKARARVKKWNAALAKFRVAAKRAGVKIRGL